MANPRATYPWVRSLPPGSYGPLPALPDVLGMPDPLPGPTRVDLADTDPANAYVRALAQLPNILPHLFPPTSSVPFCLPQLNIPVNVNAATTTTLITFQLPQARKGIIQRFGVAGSDLSNLRWSILIRGVPMPPVAGLVVQFGTIAVPTQIAGPGLWLNPQDDIQVQVTNFSLGAITAVQARIDGYLWDA